MLSCLNTKVNILHIVLQGEPIEVKHLSLNLPTSQEQATSGGSRGAKVKSRELVKSDKEDGGNDGDDNDSNDEVPLAQKQTASSALVTSEEGEGDVEMRETTPLAAVAEVEWEVSNMEVEGKEEFEAAPVAIKENKEEDEEAEEVMVQ
ncbi:hypothetical protein J132_10177 [Termitomyces sp. J132]|nr:hypothetical protein J132_10177 [Termitomyces sp. J132]